MTQKSAPFSFVKRTLPTPSKAFNTYWKFAFKRQDAFFSRLGGNIGPWSDDPIINEYKFTNCYRASDRASQYLIQKVIYSKKWSLKDTFFRVLLFKLFNKIETWEMLQNQFGELSLKTFDLTRFTQVLDNAMSSGRTIYSAAYIIPSGPKKKFLGVRKHSFHLQLLNHLMKSNFPRTLHSKKTMQDAFFELLNVESFGKFLAYQFITDLNYSDWFNYSESEFVVPGPGALDGIKKCFTNLGDYNESNVIEMMAKEQAQNFEKLNYQFQSLWGRPLQLIDCQNIFCEVDKYSRVAHPDIFGISGRTRIKQKFKPKLQPLTAWYPPKWKINEKIKPHV